MADKNKKIRTFFPAEEDKLDPLAKVRRTNRYNWSGDAMKEHIDINTPEDLDVILKDYEDGTNKSAYEKSKRSGSHYSNKVEGQAWNNTESFSKYYDNIEKQTGSIPSLDADYYIDREYNSRSNLGQAGRTLYNTAIKIGAYTLKGFAHVGGAILDLPIAAVAGDQKLRYENFGTSAVDWLQGGLQADDALTSRENRHTNNFWTKLTSWDGVNMLSDGVSFMFSALIGSGIVGKAVGAMGAARGLTAASVHTFNVVSEALVEGADMYHTFKKKYEGTINPRTGQVYTPDELEQVSTEAANGVTIGNIGLLTFTNIMETKLALGAVGKLSKKNARRVRKGEFSGKDVKFRNYSGSVVADAASETFQEGGQSSISTVQEDRKANLTDENLMVAYATEYADGLSAFYKGITGEALNDHEMEAALSQAMGFILGTGGGLRGAYSSKKADAKMVDDYAKSWKAALASSDILMHQFREDFHSAFETYDVETTVTAENLEALQSLENARAQMKQGKVMDGDNAIAGTQLKVGDKVTQKSLINPETGKPTISAQGFAQEIQRHMTEHANAEAIAKAFMIEDADARNLAISAAVENSVGALAYNLSSFMAVDSLEAVEELLDLKINGQVEEMLKLGQITEEDAEAYIDKAKAYAKSAFALKKKHLGSDPTFEDRMYVRALFYSDIEINTFESALERMRNEEGTSPTTIEETENLLEEARDRKEDLLKNKKKFKQEIESKKGDQQKFIEQGQKLIEDIEAIQLTEEEKEGKSEEEQNSLLDEKRKEVYETFATESANMKYKLATGDYSKYDYMYSGSEHAGKFAAVDTLGRNFNVRDKAFQKRMVDYRDKQIIDKGVSNLGQSVQEAQDFANSHAEGFGAFNSDPDGLALVEKLSADIQALLTKIESSSGAIDSETFSSLEKAVTLLTNLTDSHNKQVEGLTAKLEALESQVADSQDRLNNSPEVLEKQDKIAEALESTKDGELTQGLMDLTDEELSGKIFQARDNAEALVQLEGEIDSAMETADETDTDIFKTLKEAIEVIKDNLATEQEAQTLDNHQALVSKRDSVKAAKVENESGKMSELLQGKGKNLTAKIEQSKERVALQDALFDGEKETLDQEIMREYVRMMTDVVQAEIVASKGNDTYNEANKLIELLGAIEDMLRVIRGPQKETADNLEFSVLHDYVRQLQMNPLLEGEQRGPTITKEEALKQIETLQQEEVILDKMAEKQRVEIIQQRELLDLEEESHGKDSQSYIAGVAELEQLKAQLTEIVSEGRITTQKRILAQQEYKNIGVSEDANILSADEFLSHYAGQLQRLIAISKENDLKRKAKMTELERRNYERDLEGLGFGLDAKGNMVPVDTEIVKLIVDIIGQENLDKLLKFVNNDFKYVRSGAVTHLILDLIKKNKKDKKTEIQELVNYLNSIKQGSLDLVLEDDIVKGMSAHRQKTYRDNPNRAFADYISRDILQERYEKYFNDGKISPFQAFLEHNNTDQLIEDIRKDSRLSDEDKGDILSILSNHNKARAIDKVLMILQSKETFVNILQKEQAIIEGAQADKSGVILVPNPEQLSVLRELAYAVSRSINEDSSKAYSYLKGPAGSGKTKFVLNWVAAITGFKSEEILAFSHNEHSSKGIADSVKGSKSSLDNFEKEDLSTRKVVIIDEALFFDMKQTAIIEKKIEEENAKRIAENKEPLRVIFLGDPGQVKKGLGNHVEHYQSFKNMNMISPLTFTYRSDVPSIVNIQGLFRKNPNDVKEIVAVANAPMSAPYDANVPLIGVHTGSTKESLIAQVVKNAKSGRSQAIIVGNEALKKEYMDNPEIAGLLTRTDSNGNPLLVIDTYINTQGRTFQEIYVDIPRNENNGLGSAYRNTQEFNTANYTALSRAKDYIFFLNSDAKAITDVNLSADTKKLREEIEDSYNDFIEKHAIQLSAAALIDPNVKKPSYSPTNNKPKDEATEQAEEDEVNEEEFFEEGDGSEHQGDIENENDKDEKQKEDEANTSEENTGENTETAEEKKAREEKELQDKLEAEEKAKKEAEAKKAEEARKAEEAKKQKDEDPKEGDNNTVTVQPPVVEADKNVTEEDTTDNSPEGLIGELEENEDTPTTNDEDENKEENTEEETPVNTFNEKGRYVHRIQHVETSTAMATESSEALGIVSQHQIPNDAAVAYIYATIGDKTGVFVIGQTHSPVADKDGNRPKRDTWRILGMMSKDELATTNFGKHLSDQMKNKSPNRIKTSGGKFVFTGSGKALSPVETVKANLKDAVIGEGKLLDLKELEFKFNEEINDKTFGPGAISRVIDKIKAVFSAKTKDSQIEKEVKIFSHTELKQNPDLQGMKIKAGVPYLILTVPQGKTKKSYYSRLTPRKMNRSDFAEGTRWGPAMKAYEILRDYGAKSPKFAYGHPIVSMLVKKIAMSSFQHSTSEGSVPQFVQDGYTYEQFLEDSGKEWFKEGGYLQEAEQLSETDYFNILQLAKEMVPLVYAYQSKDIEVVVKDLTKLKEEKEKLRAEYAEPFTIKEVKLSSGAVVLKVMQSDDVNAEPIRKHTLTANKGPAAIAMNSIARANTNVPFRVAKKIGGSSAGIVTAKAFFSEHKSFAETRQELNRIITAEAAEAGFTSEQIQELIKAVSSHPLENQEQMKALYGLMDYTIIKDMLDKRTPISFGLMAQQISSSPQLEKEFEDRVAKFDNMYNETADNVLNISTLADYFSDSAFDEKGESVVGGEYLALPLSMSGVTKNGKVVEESVNELGKDLNNRQNLQKLEGMLGSKLDRIQPTTADVEVSSYTGEASAKPESKKQEEEEDDTMFVPEEQPQNPAEDNEGKVDTLPQATATPETTPTTPSAKPKLGEKKLNNKQIEAYVQKLSEREDITTIEQGLDAFVGMFGARPDVFQLPILRNKIGAMLLGKQRAKQQAAANQDMELKEEIDNLNDNELQERLEDVLAELLQEDKLVLPEGYEGSRELMNRLMKSSNKKDKVLFVVLAEKMIGNITTQEELLDSAQTLVQSQDSSKTDPNSESNVNAVKEKLAKGLTTQFNGFHYIEHNGSYYKVTTDVDLESENFDEIYSAHEVIDVSIYNKAINNKNTGGKTYTEANDGGRTISFAEAKKLARKYIPAFKKSLLNRITFGWFGRPSSMAIELRFVTKAQMAAVSGGKDLKGLYLDGVVYLLSKPDGVQENVLRHELFHKIWSEYMTPVERHKLKLSVGRKLGNVYMNDLQIEEYLAEQFEVYQNEPKTFTGRIAAFFRNLARMLGFARDNRGSIERMFQDISNGTYNMSDLDSGNTTGQRAYKDLMVMFGTASNFKRAVHETRLKFNAFINEDSAAYTYTEVYDLSWRSYLQELESNKDAANFIRAKLDKLKAVQAVKPNPILEAKIQAEERNLYEVEQEIGYLELLTTTKKDRPVVYKSLIDYIFPDEAFRKRNSKKAIDEFSWTDDDSFTLEEFQELLAVNMADQIDSSELQDPHSKMSTSVKLALSTIYDAKQKRFIPLKTAFAKMLHMMEMLDFNLPGSSEDFLSMFSESARQVSGLSAKEWAASIEQEDSSKASGGATRAVYQMMSDLYGKVTGQFAISIPYNTGNGIGRTPMMMQYLDEAKRIKVLNDNVIVILKPESTIDIKEFKSMGISQLKGLNGTEVVILTRDSIKKQWESKAENENKEFTTAEFVNLVAAAAINMQVFKARTEGLPLLNQLEFGNNVVNALIKQEQAANTLREMGALFSSMREKNMVIAEITNDYGKKKYVYKPAVGMSNKVAIQSLIMNAVNQYLSLEEGTVQERSEKTRKYKDMWNRVLEKGKATNKGKSVDNILQITDAKVLKTMLDALLDELGLSGVVDNVSIDEFMQDTKDFLLFFHTGTNGKMGSLNESKGSKWNAMTTADKQDYLSEAGLTEETLRAQEPELFEDRADWFDDINNRDGSSINKLSRILDIHSYRARATSVKDSEGKQVWLHHLSSQAEDLFRKISMISKSVFSGGTGTRKLLKMPAYMGTRFIKVHNIFANGLQKIYKLVDHDGMKLVDRNRAVPYRKESPQDWHRRTMSAAFFASVSQSSSALPKFVLFPYTISNKPRTKGVEINVLSPEKIELAMENFLNQYSERGSEVLRKYKNYAKNFKKDINFEIMGKAVKQLAESGDKTAQAFLKEMQDEKSPLNPYGIPQLAEEAERKAFNKKLITVMKQELDKLSEEFAETMLKLKMDLPIEAAKAFKKLESQGLIDEKVLAPFRDEKGKVDYSKVFGSAVEDFRSTSWDKESESLTSTLSKEQMLALTDTYFKNTYINSFFMNQMVVGDYSFFKHSLDIIKRMSGVYAQGQRGIVNEDFGMKQKFHMAVVNDPTETSGKNDKTNTVGIKKFLTELVSNHTGKKVSDYNQLTDAQKQKVSKLLAKFGNSFDPTDAQGFILPRRADQFRLGFGKSFNVGHVFKGVHYENRVVLDEAGVEHTVPAFIKYSSVELTDELVAEFPELSNLRERMENAREGKGVDELVFESGVKVGAPLGMVENADSLLSGEGSIEQDAILELDNDYYRMQSNPHHDTAEGRSSTAIPSQLVYFMSVMEELAGEVNNPAHPKTRAYSYLSKLFEEGANNFFAKFKNADGSWNKAKIESQLKRMMDSPNNERYYELMQAGVSINNPLIVNKILSSIFSNMTKSSVGQRFKGEKLVLQTAWGTKGHKRYDGTTQELSFSTKGKKLIAEVILPRGVLTPEMELQIMNGEEVFLSSDALGFRIPSTEIHSAVSLKVVGFHPNNTNIVIAPKELVPLHGSDFDVDSLFVISRESLNEDLVDYTGKTPVVIAKKGEFLGYEKTSQKIGSERSKGLHLSDKNMNAVEKQLEEVEKKTVDKIEALNAKRTLMPDGKLSKLNKADDALMSSLRKSLRNVRKARQAFYKNIILENILKVINSEDNLERMLSPISMDRFNDTSNPDSVFSMIQDMQEERARHRNPNLTEEEAKEARQIQNRPDLSNPLGNYEVYKSNMEGLMLTGIFANITKVFAYFLNAGRRIGKERSASIRQPVIIKYVTKKGDEKQKTVFIQDTHNITMEMVQALYPRLDIKAFKPIPLAGSSALMSKFTNAGALVSEVLDGLVNSAIDNVKEQILAIINANNLTSKLFGAGLLAGINEKFLTRLALHPIIKLMDANSSAGRETKAMYSALGEIKDFSKEEVAELASSEQYMEKALKDGFRIFPDAITFEEGLAKLKEELSEEEFEEVRKQMKVVLFYATRLFRQGNDLTVSSTALNVLKGLPSDMAGANNMMEAWSGMFSGVDLFNEGESAEKEAMPFDEALEDNETLDNLFEENNKQDPEENKSDTPLSEDELQEIEEELEEMEDGDSAEVVNDTNTEEKPPVDITNSDRPNIIDKENLSLLGKFSYGIGNIFNVVPHLFSALKTYVRGMHMIRSLFTKYNNKIDKLLKPVRKNLSYSGIKLDNSKTKNFEMIRDNFFHFLATGIPMVRELLSDSSRKVMTADKTKGGYTLTGVEAWSQNFLERLDKFKLANPEFKENLFISNVAVRQSKSGIFYQQFVAGSGLQYEEIKAIEEHFEQLRDIDSIDANGKIVKRPEGSEGYSEFQKDFLRYAIMSFGLKFAATNYGQVLPATLIKEATDQMDKYIEDSIANNDVSFLTKAFEVQMVLKHGKDNLSGYSGIKPAIIGKALVRKDGTVDFNPTEKDIEDVGKKESGYIQSFEVFGTDSTRTYIVKQEPKPYIKSGNDAYMLVSASEVGEGEYKAVYVKLGKPRDRAEFVLSPSQASPLYQEIMNQPQIYSPLRYSERRENKDGTVTYTIPSYQQTQLRLEPGKTVAATSFADRSATNLKIGEVTRVEGKVESNGKRNVEVTVVPFDVQKLEKLIDDVKAVSGYDMSYLFNTMEAAGIAGVVKKEMEDNYNIDERAVRLEDIQTSSRNSKQLLQLIASRRTDRLGKIARYLLDSNLSNIDVKIEFKKMKKNIGGEYNLGTNIISINSELYQEGVDAYEVDHTIIHEIIHALSARALASSETKLTYRQKIAKKNLQELYKQVKTRVSSDALQNKYGLKNIDEFIAEAFSNPEFQSYLNNVKVSNDKTFLEKFKEFITKLLGIDAGIKEDSVLAGTLSEVIELNLADDNKLLTEGKEGIIGVLNKEQQDESSDSESESESKKKSVKFKNQEIVEKLQAEQEKVKVVLDQNGEQTDQYEDARTGTPTLLNRVSDTFTGFLKNFTNFGKNIDPNKTLGEVKADKMWEGKSKEIKLTVYTGEQMNYNEYVDFVNTTVKFAKTKGLIVHKLMELYTIDPTTRSQEEVEKLQGELTKLIQDSEHIVSFEQAFGWLEDPVNANDTDENPYTYREMLFDKLGINFFNKKRTNPKGWAEDAYRDKVYTEITVASKLLGFAGTADMLAHHPDGTFTLVDWKTGKGIDKDYQTFMMKYGSQFSNVFDNAQSRAKLQTMFYAFMMKVENPEMVFRNITPVWIPNKYHAKRFSLSMGVEVPSYLAMIEAFYKTESPEIYKKIKEQSPNAFNSKHYSGTKRTIAEEAAAKKIHPGQALLTKQQQLKELIQSKGEERFFTDAEKKQIKRLTTELTEMADIEGYDMAAWDSDISWGSRYLGLQGNVNHPLVKAYHRKYIEAKDAANKELQQNMRKFRVLITAALKDSPSYNAATGMLGLNFVNPAVTFEWAYTTYEKEGQVLERYLTENDAEFANLTKAQQNLLTFINNTYADFVGANGLFHRTAARKEGKFADELVSDLDLYNQGRAAHDRFEYVDGFIPVVAPTMQEIRHKYGSFSREHLRMMWNRYATLTEEYEYDLYGDDANAIPLKGLGSAYQRSEGLYSKNIALSFAKFMEGALHKKHMDEVNAYSRGLQATLYASKNRDAGDRHLETFLTNMNNLNVIRRREEKVNLTKKGLGFVDKNNKAKQISVTKIIQSGIKLTSAALMWLSLRKGTQNAIVAAGLTTREMFYQGMTQGRVGKMLGIEVEANEMVFDGVISGLFGKDSKGELAVYTKDLVTGNIVNNKLYQLAKDFRFLTNAYDLTMDNKELVALRNNLLSDNTMYAAHSIPEELNSVFMLSAMLRSMKVTHGKYKGKSMFELYEPRTRLDEFGNEYVEYDVPSDLIRGYRTVNGEKVPIRGLTAQEMENLRQNYTRTHGAYRSDEKLAIEYYWWGRVIAQFKRHMPSILKSQFESKAQSSTLGYYRPVMGNDGKPVTMRDDLTGHEMPVMEWEAKIVEGRFKTFIHATRAFFNVFGEGNSEYKWNNLTAEQKRSVVEGYLSLVTILALWIGFAAAAGDYDDEDMRIKITKYSMDTFSQSWNLRDMAKSITSYTTPVAGQRMYKNMEGASEMLFSALQANGLWFGSSDKAYTKRGDLKGMNELLRGLPGTSVWYSNMRDLESMEDD